MNQYLAVKGESQSLEDDEELFFNVTLSIAPYVPFTVYFCYSLPEKTEKVWIDHYMKFVNFQDFEYAFM